MQNIPSGRVDQRKSVPESRLPIHPCSQICRNAVDWLRRRRAGAVSRLAVRLLARFEFLSDSSGHLGPVGHEPTTDSGRSPQCSVSLAELKSDRLLVFRHSQLLDTVFCRAALLRCFDRRREKADSWVGRLTAAGLAEPLADQIRIPTQGKSDAGIYKTAMAAFVADLPSPYPIDEPSSPRLSSAACGATPLSTAPSRKAWACSR